jgi:excisionase family DNA binding protein
MKHRSTQLGVRKNPDSPRVHGLRFTVNSSSLESMKEFKNLHDQPKAFSSPPRKTESIELPLTDAVNETTLGRERASDQFLSVKEVAALLHLPVSWVYGRMRKGASERLPGYRLGKYWRFRENEVLAWVDSQRGDFHAT